MLIDDLSSYLGVSLPLASIAKKNKKKKHILGSFKCKFSLSKNKMSCVEGLLKRPPPPDAGILMSTLPSGG